jgi:membrane protease YdiL (CAAX protease family)
LLVNHILFFLILIALPTYVFFNTKKIKESIDPRVKEITYYKIFVFYWVSVLCLILFSDLPRVFYVQTFDLSGIWTVLAYVAAAYIFFIHLVPLFMISFSSRFRKLTAASFDKKSFVFPTTTRQRYLFIIVPITVGICEEIIYRGYLYQYFQNAPFNLSAVVSFLLVCVIFGIGHYQQGVSGVIMTMILGYFLGYLYFVTGNLYLSIIFHILFDAKILYISWTLNNYQSREADTINQNI